MNHKNSNLNDFFANKTGFWWSFLYEVLCMFSNKPSFFASKRWERFFMFNLFLWMVAGYVVRSWYKLSTTEIIELSAVLLAGGAWNTVQIRKDQKNEPTLTSNADQQ